MRVLVLFAVIVACVYAGLSVQRLRLGQEPVFVDTQKVLEAYPAMIAANSSIGEDEKRWKASLTETEDSLKSVVDSMSRKYNTVDASSRSEFRNQLELMNMEAGVTRHVGSRNTMEFAQRTLQPAVDQFNADVAAFTRRHGYEVLFGSPKGAVILGTGGRADKTSELIEFVNTQGIAK